MIKLYRINELHVIIKKIITMKSMFKYLFSLLILLTGFSNAASAHSATSQSENDFAYPADTTGSSANYIRLMLTENGDITPARKVTYRMINYIPNPVKEAVITDGCAALVIDQSGYYSLSVSYGDSLITNRVVYLDPDEKEEIQLPVYSKYGFSIENLLTDKDEIYFDDFLAWDIYTDLTFTHVNPEIEYFRICSYIIDTPKISFLFDSIDLLIKNDTASLQMGQMLSLGIELKYKSQDSIFVYSGETDRSLPGPIEYYIPLSEEMQNANSYYFFKVYRGNTTGYSLEIITSDGCPHTSFTKTSDGKSLKVTTTDAAPVILTASDGYTVKYYSNDELLGTLYGVEKAKNKQFDESVPVTWATSEGEEWDFNTPLTEDLCLYPSTEVEKRYLTHFIINPVRNSDIEPIIYELKVKESYSKNDPYITYKPDEPCYFRKGVITIDYIFSYEEDYYRIPGFISEIKSDTTLYLEPWMHEKYDPEAEAEKANPHFSWKFFLVQSKT